MKFLKRALSFLMAAVIAMTAMAFSCSAASILDTAKAIKSGRTYKTTLSTGYTDNDYKIVVSEAGELKIKFSASCNSVCIILYDSSGNTVPVKDFTEEAGYVSMLGGGVGDGFVEFQWNSSVDKAAGTVKFDVKKGTYYIRATTNRVKNTSLFDNNKVIIAGTGEYSFKATYPNAESKYKVKYLSLTLNKGNSIDLGVALTANAKVSWTSSNEKVAKVSSDGKVTAVAKGSAIITAKVGNSSKKMKIIVK